MTNRLNAKTVDRQHSFGDDVNTSVFVSIFLLFFGVFAILVSFRTETAVVDTDRAQVSSGKNGAIVQNANDQNVAAAGDVPARLINSMATIHSDVRQNSVQYEEGDYQVVAFKIPVNDLFSQNGSLPKPAMRFFLERLTLFTRNNVGDLSRESIVTPLILDISLGTDQQSLATNNEIIKQRLAFISGQLTERLDRHVIFRQGVIDASRDSLFVTISIPKLVN